MNRVETYRQKRQFKRKIKVVLILFILFVLIGISVADYSVNSLMKNEKKIEMVTLDDKKDYYVFDLLGKKIYINIAHIRKDCEKVKNILKGITG